MKNSNFFQTPKNTSYGALTHVHHNNIHDPLVHYCVCGGIANVVITQSELFQVKCSFCSRFSVANKIKPIAIYNWNMSKLSQFPSRLTIIPFRVTNHQKYSPVALLSAANNALKNSNENMDPVVVSAINYSLKWCQWLNNNFVFMSDDAISKQLIAFNEQFIDLADQKLSDHQKSYLKIFKLSHKGLNDIALYRKFLKLHCKSVLASVNAEIDYPNRLIKAA